MWILEKPKPIDSKVVADLLKNPIIRFQDRYYGLLFVATNTIFTLFVGWCFKDYIGAFVFAWLTRMFFLHHFTWFINSLAHTWGTHHFSREHSAVDNYIISLVTFGEGYHNYHHTFAGDYRNGIRWFHFDPTKWLIWTLSKIGLAKSLRKVPDIAIQEKILLSQKQELLDRCNPSSRDKIVAISENLLAKLREIAKLKEQQTELLKQKNKEHLFHLIQEMKKMKKGMKKQVKDWMDLSRDALTS
jgi:stearoyl-CoA desaturase (delta-9 desaturase)